MCRERYCTHRWYDSNSYAGRQRQMDTTWRAWLVDTTRTSYSQDTWGIWTTAATTTSTITSTLSINGGPTIYANGAYRVAPLSAEELEAKRLARTRRDQESQERIARRDAAAKAAEELLMSCLTEEQQQELKVLGRFHVVGGRSGRRYCINRGREGNVSCRPAASGPLIKYCIHDYAGLPAADTMLGQKLMLETNEDEFLRIANAS